MLGKASGHPGKTIAENRWPLPATIACSLAAFLGTAKRKKGVKSQGNHSAVYSHGIWTELPQVGRTAVVVKHLSARAQLLFCLLFLWVTMKINDLIVLFPGSH